MIESSFFYSIADKQVDNDITLALTKLHENKATPQTVKEVLKYTLECAEKGAYPSRNYYAGRYELNDVKILASKVEILSSIDRVKAFFEQQYYLHNIIEASNKADDPIELYTNTQEVLDELAELVGIKEDIIGFTPLSQETLTTPCKGIPLGLPSIDSVTGGFMPGQVATVAAFSGGGKSTFWLNAAYNNVMAGRKVAYISLEMDPNILWEMMLAKYMSHEKICPELLIQDLRRRKLKEDQLQLILKHQGEFDAKFKNNLLILDERHISRLVLSSPDTVKRFYARLDKELGGLDLVIWDHVHQLELMNPKAGDAILRNIASATKTYTNSQGISPVCGWACQVNREGYKEAKSKKQKMYDLTAIGDLNEVIRSSSYILFLFKEEDTAELSVTMNKHRYGEPILEPIRFGFDPAKLNIVDNAVNIKENTSELPDGSTFEDDDEEKTSWKELFGPGGVSDSSLDPFIKSDTPSSTTPLNVTFNAKPKTTTTQPPAPIEEKSSYCTIQECAKTIQEDIPIEVITSESNDSINTKIPVSDSRRRGLHSLEVAIEILKENGGSMHRAEFKRVFYSKGFKALLTGFLKNWVSDVDYDKDTKMLSLRLSS
jgi:replicative DNA helicase